jgi:tetratricopeptide (TPR) repeat protein
MFLRAVKYLLTLVLAVSATSFQSAVFAQKPVPSTGPMSRGGINTPDSSEAFDLDIQVKGANGGPIDVMAMVTLISYTGQISGQGTTLGGNISFRGLSPSRYTIEVVAAGYEKAVKELDGHEMRGIRIVIEMRPESNVEKMAPGPPRIILAPKAQKELGKALEALRANKLSDARSHLDAAYRLAPNHPEVNYLFGVYFSLSKDLEQAKSYWMKTVEFDPKHTSALLALSEALMRERRLPDAEAYGNRAVEADPSSWRAHAILAEVCLQQHQTEEAIKHAERALELGHGEAANVQPLLARALAAGGNRDRATKVLQEYIQKHPENAGARKQLESMQISTAAASTSAAASPVEVKASAASEGAAAEVKASTPAEATVVPPLPSSWLPPDVDETVPPVEPGAVCALDEVLEKTGKRVLEFVKAVDRFTANEFLKHESINKWGGAGAPETRKFNYVVAIEETRPGILNVEEYRLHGDSPVEFPGGVATLGLPALALIFHPYNAGNFEMTCEGLGRWNGQPVWQVHFRQRADKPNTFREYRVGQNGPAFPVGVRGRAMIAVDTYQILRMETDLVDKIPQIRLVADHMVVEYGPVSFRNRNVQMWLPQTAELYSEWKGHRIHRIHSFSNYLLFSVDEKQQISAPKEK